MRDVIFGVVLWGYVLAALALHAVDVRRRKRTKQLPLEQYRNPRPVDWALGGLVAFGAVAAAFDGLELYRVWHADAGLEESFPLLVGLAVVAIVLCFVGVRGINHVTGMREEFLVSPGATQPHSNFVLVNIDREALLDAATTRRYAWPLYLVGCIPLGAASYELARATPQYMTFAALAMVVGAALVGLILAVLPTPYEEDVW